MRKVIYGVLFLALIGIFTVSCEKDALVPTAPKTASSFEQLDNIYTDGKLLIFKNVEAYEAVVQMPTEAIEKEFRSRIAKMDYTSYQETKKTFKDGTDLVNDDYLAAILNEDLAVQIGAWIYRVNKMDEKVFALSVNNASEYPDLVAENLSNKYILAFSTEDNVIELLESGYTFQAKALSKKCHSSQEDNTGWLQYADFVDVNNIYGNGDWKRYKFKQKMRVRYDNWGIYRKLFAEFDHKESFGGTFDETYFSMQVYGSYLVRNGSGGNYSLFPSYQIYGTPYMNSTTDDFYDFIDDRKELQVYRGVRCLCAFELRGWAVFRNRETLKPNLSPNDGSGVYIRGNCN